MTESAPEGYEIVGDKIVNTNTKEWFFIRNLSFKEINHYFRELPSRIINQLIKLPHDGKIKILDVGGGSKSKASGDIARNYSPFTAVFNADLIAGGEKITNLHKVSSDMFKLPFGDKSFDLIYTRQVLTYFDPGGSNDENLLKEKNVLTEIVRVLKTGGVAFVEEEYYSRLPQNHPDLKDISEKLSVTINQKESGLFLSLNDRLQKLIDPLAFPPGHFLIIDKGSLNNSIKHILDATPFKLPPHRTA